MDERFQFHLRAESHNQEPVEVGHAEMTLQRIEIYAEGFLQVLGQVGHFMRLNTRSKHIFKRHLTYCLEQNLSKNPKHLQVYLGFYAALHRKFYVA